MKLFIISILSLVTLSACAGKQGRQYKTCYSYSRTWIGQSDVTQRTTACKD
jgi:hypothetical protein